MLQFLGPEIAVMLERSYIYNVVVYFTLAIVVATKLGIKFSSSATYFFQYNHAKPPYNTLAKQHTTVLNHHITNLNLVRHFLVVYEPLK